MKTNGFLPCRLCGHRAEADWTLIDPETDWQSYFIGCSNEVCDTMLSMEFHAIPREHKPAVEAILLRAWNELQRIS
jgi:hypothetical protein